ncbi:MAG: hypothetical protein Q9168_004047 [Polycauliona sp. 1 TL-2023]
MSKNGDNGFRAIIVGGGAAGLVASHAFSKAGIDHIVLERGSEAAPPTGASFAVYPHGARILQQLGILDDCKAIAEPLQDGATNRWPDGSPVSWSDVWRFIRENHGTDLLLLERRAYLEVLWQNLPDKSKVVFNKKVADIVETEHGVEVFLGDGTSEKGDMVVGADGVHSTVREKMWERANRLEPGIIDVKEKKAITTQWKCLLGYGPGEPQMRNEISVVYSNKRRSFLLGTQPKQCFYFVFQRVKERPWTRDNRPHYSQEDAEKMAAEVADLPVSETMVFGELWRKRWRGAVVDIEEGVLSRWHYRRTVLVGDAAHKVTPNIALGGNSGMESVVVLTNVLRRILLASGSSSSSSCKPSLEALTEGFQAYQDQHLPRMRHIMEFSRLVTRTQAWDSWGLKMLSIWVVPYLPQRKMANDLGEIIRTAPKLDFVPLGDWDDGLLEWEDMEQETGPKTHRGAGDVLKGWPVPSLWIAVLAGLLLLWAFCRTALVRRLFF